MESRIENPHWLPPVTRLPARSDAWLATLWPYFSPRCSSSPTQRSPPCAHTRLLDFTVLGFSLLTKIFGVLWTRYFKMRRQRLEPFEGVSQIASAVQGKPASNLCIHVAGTFTRSAGRSQGPRTPHLCVSALSHGSPTPHRPTACLGLAPEIGPTPQCSPSPWLRPRSRLTSRSPAPHPVSGSLVHQPSGSSLLRLRPYSPPAAGLSPMQISDPN